MITESLVIDRTWRNQDGALMALCVTGKKLPATVAIPRDLPAGSRVLAQRVRDGWRFVKATGP